jgi:hypothetical protein
MTPRSFPLPWSSEEHSGHLVVKDKNGQAIACVYYENAAGRRPDAKLLTKDEARRIAATSPHRRKKSCAIQRGNAKKNGRLSR